MNTLPQTYNDKLFSVNFGTFYNIIYFSNVITITIYYGADYHIFHTLRPITIIISLAQFQLL